MITADEIIEQAQRWVGVKPAKGATEQQQTLDALEGFFGSGVEDEQAGSITEGTGHIYRVEQWTVTTDTDGTKTLDEHPSIAAAKRAVERIRELSV